MKGFRRFFAAMFVLTTLSASGFAQGSAHYGPGMKVNLNEDGSKYFRLVLWNQIWTRLGQMNPGSVVNGETKEYSWDVGARRLRMMVYSQISPRFLVLAHIGINNQTFATGGATGNTGTGANGAGKKPGLFFHDAYNEYAIRPLMDPVTKTQRKFSMYLGAGLHNWYGLSRQSSASTQNILTIDVPVINWPLAEQSDQFNRQYGIYAKGRVGKATYRVSLDKPFATNLTPAFDSVRGRVAVDNNGDAAPAIQGYFDYQFKDQEADLLPFRVGTYVGTKKVFNVGAGFYHQSAGTKSVDGSGQVTQHPINLFAADIFADLPVGPKEKGMALTALATFYQFDFGPNYVRSLALMNTATGWDPATPVTSRAIQGFGNARLFVGSGQLVYTQAGLLLPSRKGAEAKIRVQPFVAYTMKNLQYVGRAGSYFDVGTNLFLDGHQAKLTPQWSLRPLYLQNGSSVVREGYRSEYLLQFQVCI